MSKVDQFRDQYIEQFDFPYCEEVSKYEKQAKIGQVFIKGKWWKIGQVNERKIKILLLNFHHFPRQGTFGEVFKARDRKNKHKVGWANIDWLMSIEYWSNIDPY